MRENFPLVLSTSLNLLLAVLLLILFSTGADRHPQRMSLELLEIVDSTGSGRLVLTVDEQDNAVLQMTNRTGVAVVALEAGLANDPSFEFRNANGTTQLSLSLTNGDLPWLDMTSKEDDDVVALGLNSYGAPSLEMSDIAYKRHADIRFDEAGYFGFAAYGPDFEDRVRIGVLADGVPAVELFGLGEQRLASIDLHENRPYITFWDDEGGVLLEFPDDVVNSRPSN